jgi:hypothetical protein
VFLARPAAALASRLHAEIGYRISSHIGGERILCIFLFHLSHVSFVNFLTAVLSVVQIAQQQQAAGRQQAAAGRIAG